MRRIVHLGRDWGDIVHGGVLRSQQVSNLVSSASSNVEPLTISHWKRLKPSDLLSSAINSSTKVRHLPQFGVRAVANVGRLDTALAQFRISGDDILVHESSPQLIGATHLFCKRRNLSPIIFPHNVEALVHRTPPRRAGVALGREMEAFQAARLVACISSVDAEILELFGVSSVICPFIPAPQRVLELSAIRSARSSAEKRPVLIVGSVGNAPTRAGIRRQIELLADRAVRTRLPVVVVGNGTETFGRSPAPNVTVHGRVTPEVMADLWVHSSMAWVNQPRTTGALTRITELTLAGVGVVANKSAADAVPREMDIRANDRIETISDMINSPYIPELPIEYLKNIESEVRQNFREAVFA